MKRHMGKKMDFGEEFFKKKYITIRKGINRIP